MDVDASALARTLKFGGKAQPAEVIEVKARLVAQQSDPEAHNLLRIVGMACPPTNENIALVEAFLGENVDDYSRQGAIYALCSYWKLTALYLERLLRFCDPSSWEAGSATSIAALEAIGKQLNKVPDKSVLSKIVAWLEEELKGKEVESRDVYIEALHKAIDTAIRGPDVIKTYIRRRFPRDVDWDLIERAKHT